MATTNAEFALAEVPVVALHSNGPNGSNGATDSAPPSRASNMSGMNGTAESKTIQPPATGLTDDEMALYDRQIRLWGAQAQERIRSAKILLVSLRALGTEIAKNLTLAGISSLTIVDDEEVTEEDLGAQYFLRAEDIGKKRAEAAIPRIQELNPHVSIQTDGGLQDLLMKDQNYYAPFDCVIACDHDIMTLSMINTAARFASRPFYCAGIHGFYGYVFADLVCHEFVIEREKSNMPTNIAAESMTRSVIGVTTKKESDGKTIEIVQKAEMYCPLILANTSPLPPDILNNPRKLRGVLPLLPCLRALFDFERQYSHLPNPAVHDDLIAFTTLATTKARELQLPAETLQSDFLRSFIINIGAEITPTASFVGGRLSQDVINVLGKREQPIQNFAIFDGDALEGPIYCLYSLPPELALQTFDPMMAMSMDMPVDMAVGNGLPPTDMAFENGSHQADMVLGTGPPQSAQSDLPSVQDQANSASIEGQEMT